MTLGKALHPGLHHRHPDMRHFYPPGTEGSRVPLPQPHGHLAPQVLAGHRPSRLLSLNPLHKYTRVQQFPRRGPWAFQILCCEWSRVDRPELVLVGHGHPLPQVNAGWCNFTFIRTCQAALQSGGTISVPSSIGERPGGSTFLPFQWARYVLFVGS